MRRLAIGVLLLLLVAPPARAGSPGNPEVLDAYGSTAIDPSLDVLAAWLDTAPTSFTIHWRVRDLAPPAAGATDQWTLAWVANGASYLATLQRGADGDSGAIQRADLGPSSRQTALASWSFDDANDVATLTLPRQYLAGSANEATFTDGTLLQDVRAAGLRRASPGSAFETLDTTPPGPPARLGATPATNAHATLTPVAPVTRIDAGGAASVTVRADAAGALPLDVPLAASIDLPGWTVTPARSLLVAAPTATTALQVRAPATAAPGDLAILTLDGGAMRAQALLVVGDPSNVQRALDQQAVAPDASSSTLTWWLEGGSPLAAGHLVASPPAAGPGETVPLGQWRTDPLAAPLTLHGAARVTLPGAGRFVAILGADPLPATASLDAPPAGVALLASDGAGAASGQVDLSLEPGDRLAISLVGAGTARVYAADAPARLDVTLATGRSNASVAFDGRLADFVVPLPPQPLAANATLLSPLGAPTALRTALVPVTLSFGADAPAVRGSREVSFGAADAEGATRSVAILIPSDAASWSATMTAPGEADLELVRDGVVVKASRAPGGIESLALGPLDLQRLGSGAYRLDVTLRQRGPLAVHLEEGWSGHAEIDGALAQAHAIWDASGAPLGNYTLRVAGREIVYERTPDGITQRPNAAFSAPADGAVGAPIAFVDASGDPDGALVAWSWDFGDGNASQLRAPTHVFAAPGSYQVTLVARDDLGATASATRTIEIVRHPSAPAFRVEPASPRAGESALFVDATRPGDAPVSSWLWQFGDGESSTEATPVHVFASPGTFVVRLSVDDGFGASTIEQPVVVLPASFAVRFSIPAQPVVGAALAFHDLTTGSDAPRSWEFGDGTQAQGPDASHAFQSPGVYNVTLHVGGARQTVPLLVAPDHAGFHVEPASPVVGAPATFVDESGAPPSWSRAWSFGDGAVAEGVFASHAFAQSGTYSVTLTLTTPDARIVRQTLPVVVSPRAPAVAPRSVAELPASRYQTAYAAGLPHDEAYPTLARDVELQGLLGGEYLDHGAYVYGRAAPNGARREGGSLVAVTVAGAAAESDADSARESSGNAEAAAYKPAGASWSVDYADGALPLVARSEADGPITTETRLLAGAGTWIAYGAGDGVRVVPLARADRLVLAPDAGGSLWIAAFDPAGRDVAGVLLSGLVSATLESTPQGVLVHGQHGARAAQTLVAYRVSSAASTRYAGVQELAREDASEVGLVILREGDTQALAWPGSGALVQARSVGSLWDRVQGTRAAWTLTVAADASQGGKTLRLVLPADLASDGLEIALDGQVLDPATWKASTDGSTMIVTLPVSHFSLRTVSVRAVSPGVSPFFLYLTGGLAAVASAETLYILVRRRKAGPQKRAPPVELSADARRQQEMKDALLKRLRR